MNGDHFEMFFNDLTFHTFYFSEKNYLNMMIGLRKFLKNISKNS